MHPDLQKILDQIDHDKYHVVIVPLGMIIRFKWDRMVMDDYEHVLNFFDTHAILLQTGTDPKAVTWNFRDDLRYAPSYMFRPGRVNRVYANAAPHGMIVSDCEKYLEHTSAVMQLKAIAKAPPLCTCDVKALASVGCQCAYSRWKRR